MDDRTEQGQPEADHGALEDLDVDQADADKVTGGDRRSGDPCDGGEITSP